MKMNLDVDVVSADCGEVVLQITAGGRTLVWNTDQKNTAKMANLVGQCIRIGCTFVGSFSDDKMKIEDVTVRR